MDFQGIPEQVFAVSLSHSLSGTYIKYEEAGISHRRFFSRKNMGPVLRNRIINNLTWAAQRAHDFSG